jgi:hypothetical protein
MNAEALAKPRPRRAALRAALGEVGSNVRRELTTGGTRPSKAARSAARRGFASASAGSNIFPQEMIVFDDRLRM